MDKIRILDCTLRDGGWVNDFNFGIKAMQSILNAVEYSGIEYVELGYLNAWNGSSEGRSEYSSMEAVNRNILQNGKNPQTSYLVMIDYGKYPVEWLPECQEMGIDGVRLCFHKKDALEAMAAGQKILDKGYALLLQPMVCTRYTDDEFRQLISLAQEKLKGLSAFYLVDSFGSMRQKDVIKRLQLADKCLYDGISLGLHTHNNMQLSFSNAVAASALELNRNLIVDGTLLGIGKGPGNMNTEVFAEYLNQNCGKRYELEWLNITAETLMRSIKKKYPWGYRREFYLSAKHCLTPSYAKLYFSEYHLNLETIDELLARIPDDKKDSFDRITAEQILEDYRKMTEKVERYDGLAGC